MRKEVEQAPAPVQKTAPIPLRLRLPLVVGLLREELPTQPPSRHLTALLTHRTHLDLSRSLCPRPSLAMNLNS